LKESGAFVATLHLVAAVLNPLYINDLSKSLSDKSSSILFADETNFIIENRDESEFKFKTNKIFDEVNK
jgi:hypothetical protein